MQQLISILLAINGIAVAQAQGLPPALPEAPTIAYSVETAPRFITFFADLYGASSEEMLETAICESGLEENPKGYNDAGAAYGVYQFHRATFVEYAPHLGLTGADYKNPIAQIQVAAWMFANGQKAQWSCARSLGYVKQKG